MISVKRVSKYFGKLRALRQVTFDIQKGQIVGLLGPNGAGKTTMMRLLTGYFPPTEGEVWIRGKNFYPNRPQSRSRIGYLPERNPLYQDMLPIDFLHYVAKLKGVRRRDRKKHVACVMDQCGIGRVARRLIGKLSKGYQQRVGLAQALIGDPELLILDEPTVGLDPAQIIEIRNLIRHLGTERTVLMASHILPEVRMTCGSVLILNEGRLVAQGTTESLEDRLKQATELLVSVRGKWTAGDEFMHQIPHVVKVKLEREEGDRRDYVLTADPKQDIRSDIAKRILKAGFELLTLKQVEWDLENIFLKIVTQESGDLAECSS